MQSTLNKANPKPDSKPKAFEPKFVEGLFDPAEKPDHFYHYTNQSGYNGILKSGLMRASVIEGKKNTHFGKGVYFAEMSPEEMNMFGYHDPVERLFGKVDAYSVDRMRYYFEVKVSPLWTVKVGRFEASRDRDILVVPGERDLPVVGRITRHGETAVGHAIRSMPKPANCTVEQKYAGELIDGHTRKRAAQVEARQQAAKAALRK